MSVFGHVRGRDGGRQSAVRSTTVVGLVLAGLLLGGAVRASEALAAANLNWGTGITATLPGDVGISPDVELDALACPSGASCVAAGRYRDTSDARQGLLLSKTLGVWTAVKAPLPAGANIDPKVFLDSVSCPSAGNCSAVGSYHDSSDNTLGVLLSEASGTWAAGVQASLPAAATDPLVTVSSVSCTSPGDCTAVGEYNDNSNNRQGLLLTETLGTWDAGVEATLPAAATNPSVVLTSVSCVSAGNCVAVGLYNDTSGNRQGLLLTQTGGSWGTGAEAALPAAASNPNVILRSVACPSTGDCTAVGQYDDASGNTQGLLLSESSGVWATGVTAGLPAGVATNPLAYIQSLSCTAVGSCDAVGGYSDASGHSQGLLLTETSGTWGQGVKAALPAGAAADPAVSMNSVSCSSAGNCAGVGSYADGSGQQGLLLSQTSGTWAAGVKAALPAHSATEPHVVLTSAACTSVSTCTAVGRYDDDQSNRNGVIFDAAKASPRLSVLAPPGATVGRPIAGTAVSATLSLGATPTGPIQFRVFGPQASPPSSCLAGGKLVGAANASADGTYHPPAGFIPAAAGTYWWFAAYGGDAGDNAAASACGASMPRTVVLPVPTISNFKQTHVRWREGEAVAKIAFVRRPPVGTTFSFALNQPAAVKLVFSQHNKPKGSLSLAARQGRNKLRFQGRLSAKHRLKPGRYTVTITAINANHVVSAARKLSFTIVR